VVASDAVIDLSTNCEKWLGFVLMAIGAGLSTFGASLFRGFYAREKAVLQATRARTRITSIQAEIMKTCGTNPTPVITAKLNQLTADLGLAVLKANGLPRIVSSPYENADPEPARLSQYMTGIINQIAAVERIARSGLEVVALKMASATPAEMTALKAVFGKMDVIASQLTPASTPDSVQQEINDLLSPQPAHPGLWAGRLETEVDNFIPTPEHLEREIAILSVAGWFVVVTLTLFSGAYAFFL